MRPFGAIVADPPWQFRDALPGPARGAAKHYSTLTLDELQRFPLPPLAPDALLFLWRVASMQQEALLVAKAWGFRIVAEIVWVKPQIGMGHYVRNSHEVCLIGARPRAASRIVDHGVRSTFEAPRGRHSAKPPEFYRLVQQLCVGPYVELFARQRRAGWTCLGNEVPAEPAEPAELTEPSEQGPILICELCGKLGAEVQQVHHVTLQVCPDHPTGTRADAARTALQAMARREQRREAQQG